MIKKKTKVSLLSAIGLSILMGLSTVGPSYAEYQPRRDQVQKDTGHLWSQQIIWNLKYLYSPVVMNLQMP